MRVQAVQPVGTMLATLLLLGGVRLVWTADIVRDINYVTRQNVTCPASGFFFERSVDANSLSSGVCYICFCHHNNTAVCWKRENRRCDVEHYQNLGNSFSRMRRSPISFGEVFVRDAAREFFNKQSPEQCKPYESSFSDGCPPVDWCIGCTVCDCDANGHWDCHVLSFCPDKNGKKQMKKRRGYPKSRLAKRQSKTSTEKVSRSINTPKPPKNPTRKRSMKPPIRRNQSKPTSTANKQRVNQAKTIKVNKVAAIKKPLPRLQAKKALSSRNKVTSKPPVIKKRAFSGKPINIKSSSGKGNRNNTVEVAHKVVKQFMTSMQKMIKNIDRQTNNTSKQNKNGKDAQKKPKVVAKPISKVNNNNRNGHYRRNTPVTYNSSSQQYRRLKRHAIVISVSPDISVNKSETYINKTMENLETNRVQHVLNNTTSLYSNITSKNETLNRTQLKSTVKQEIYVMDNHIYKESQRTIVKDGPFYNNISNNESAILRAVANNSTQQNNSNYNLEAFSVFTTDRSHIPTNFTELGINETDVSETLQNDKDKSSKNIPQMLQFKKMLNIATQTEHHDCKLRKVLETLIGKDLYRYNDTIKCYEPSKKPKRYTVLTKIKRLIKKIFNKNKIYHKDNLYYRDHNTKYASINKFGHCKLDLKHKEKLRNSISELKMESNNILNTVRMIKGLLHLLEIETNETHVSRNLYDSTQNMEKLNAIVKDTYIEGSNGKRLTNDQRIQINYIKENVRTFVKSVGKFARILEDVIQIAMHHNKRKNDTNNTKVVHIKNYTSNHLEEDNAIKSKLEKLKTLILNYNVLQNKFINHIYFILNNLENNITKKDNLKYGNKENYKKTNKTNAIETNSANIIKNIRKLKLLAERVHFQKRRKRETINDNDALEYLLILMEYLLQRHNPVNPPVNDGIDLLIEAIKSAPDIKVIRKKVLDNITERTLVTRTPTYRKFMNKNTNYSRSNKESKEKNISSDIKKSKIKVADLSEDDDDEDDEKIEEIYRSFKSDKSVNDLTSEQREDEILLTRSIVPATTDTNDNRKEMPTTVKSYNDGNEVTSFNSMAVELETTSMTAVTAYRNVMNDDFKAGVKSNSNIDNLLVDPKANIDWIEENFKEVKQSRKLETLSSTPKSLTATRTQKSIENISDVSNENKVINEKKVEKSSAEEVMSKKQMDLLNSLDYVRERDVDDEVDAKDDKYLSDMYK